jgi:hypothetical protein
VVHRDELRPIGASCLFLLPLCRCRRVSTDPGGSQLRCRRAGAGSTTTAVIADVADRYVVYDRPAVNRRDVRGTDVVDCGVVIEPPTIPIAAEIPDAHVAKSIVDAAVKADLRPPIAGTPEVHAVIPVPVARSPERADERRFHPGPRYPVVAINRVPGPVTGRPDEAGTGTKRLRINGQRRWGDGHGDAHSDVRVRGSRRHQHRHSHQGENQSSHRNSHDAPRNPSGAYGTRPDRVTETIGDPDPKARSGLPAQSIACLHKAPHP